MITDRILSTGVNNLEHFLGAGIPAYSLNIIAGQPGTGKTILAHQIAFHNTRMSSETKVLVLTTLSEPVIKMVRYMQKFQFFDPEIFGKRIIHQDIGQIIRERELKDVSQHIEKLVFDMNPDILIIDSFKAISDLAPSEADFRRFCYDLSIRLTAARCTSFLVGEYDRPELPTGTEFAVADGIIYMEIDQSHGEIQRRLWVRKMRGQAANLTPVPFSISADGLRMLGPQIFARSEDRADLESPELIPTGIPGLDCLLQGGLLSGRCLILSGISGTGKTTLGMQFIVQGAQMGHRGMVFSYEETADSLIRLAEGFGWQMESLVREGMVKIAYIPQNTIQTEEHIEWMLREVAAFRPQRVLVDSFSVFLYKMKDQASLREKTFQMASIIRNTGAQGLLISDIPAADPTRLSRFGVEETVLDGTIVLTSEMMDLKRRRYIEVAKMRGVKNIPGRHRMEIMDQGIVVYYAESPPASKQTPPPPMRFDPVEHLIKGHLRYDASWLVRGAPGVGKSTLAIQFAIQGLKRNDSVLYVAIDAPFEDVVKAFENLNFPPHSHLDSGQLRVIDAFRTGDGAIDLADPESLLFAIQKKVHEMPSPNIVIMDSLSPVSFGSGVEEFISLVHRKNRLLGRPDISLFDVMLAQTLEGNQLHSLMNTYDIVIDLFIPDWGEMTVAGISGYRALQMTKVRGARVDGRPYPYTINDNIGIVVQKDYYRDF